MEGEEQGASLVEFAVGVGEEIVALRSELRCMLRRGRIWLCRAFLWSISADAWMAERKVKCREV